MIHFVVLTFPMLLDSAERSFDICNPSYSDVCHFKDSTHVFPELVRAVWSMVCCHMGNLSSWMDSDFQTLFSSQEMSLEKRCWMNTSADLKNKKKCWWEFKTELLICPSSCRQAEFRYWLDKKQKRHSEYHSSFAPYFWQAI